MTLPGQTPDSPAKRLRSLLAPLEMINVCMANAWQAWPRSLSRSGVPLPNQAAKKLGHSFAHRQSRKVHRVDVASGSV